MEELLIAVVILAVICWVLANFVAPVLALLVGLVGGVLILIRLVRALRV